jgi:hypothetical protein
MSSAISCTDCTSFSVFPSIGFGADFEGLRKYYDKIVGTLREAETLGRPLDEALESLTEVYKECSEENWDGYGALPITEDAYREAERLIKSLPLTSFIPMPEITPEPNGELGLEWYKENRKTFVVSVSGKNEIVFAGLFGVNRVHGTEYFGDILPHIIIENLKRLYL